jgi:protein tyrosine phosphatase (PTP) superfamily phosphohydrolase (DUF442 family)
MTPLGYTEDVLVEQPATDLLVVQGMERRSTHIKNLATGQAYRAWRSMATLTLLFVLLMCGFASAAPQTAAVACPNNLGSPIQNFCVATPDVLWRGARPDKDGVAWLIQNGVRTIVNLELIHDDKSSFDHVIIADDKKLQVGYFRIRDWEPLPILSASAVDDHVAHFLAIISQQPKPVYVHCRSGMNRTGVMVAAYRVLIEGMNEETAIKEMGSYQGQWFKTDTKYIRGLSRRRDKIMNQVKEWAPELKSDAQIICEKGTCVISEQKAD